MYVVILIAMCIMIFFYRRTKTIHIDEEGYLQKSVLSNRECQELINIAKTFEFETKPDGVDSQPEYQIDILDGDVKNEKLWKICRNIYETKIPPIDKKLNYVFLKRYTPQERTHIPLHYDDNHVTASFLLSKTSDFSGGQLYVFSLEESKKLDLIDHIIPMTIQRRNTLIDNYKNLPILKYEQGDMVKYPGGTRMHGTLPVTSGERYVLTYFFN